MSKNLNDLNELLFEQLERINDKDLSEEELSKEIKRSDTMCNIAGNIINNANTVLKAFKMQDDRWDADSKLPKMLGTENDQTS